MAFHLHLNANPYGEILPFA